jgi:hypothetical protein
MSSSGHQRSGQPCKAHLHVYIFAKFIAVKKCCMTLKIFTVCPLPVSYIIMRRKVNHISRFVDCGILGRRLHFVCEEVGRIVICAAALCVIAGEEEFLGRGSRPFPTSYEGLQIWWGWNKYRSQHGTNKVHLPINVKLKPRSVACIVWSDCLMISGWEICGGKTKLTMLRLVSN